MNIVGMEKLSLVDFDGCVATTLFTGGCNFRCPFCHNAVLVVDHNNIPKISEQKIFDYLNKRKGILEGVCISGGEPTLNADLFDFCKKIKDIGYKVKLDTNGTNFDLLYRLATSKVVDYFAIDIKNDLDNYGAIIGRVNFDPSIVKDSVEFLIKSNFDYEFRTTLIDQFHKKENIVAISHWIKGAKKYFLQKFKDSENCLTRGLTPVSLEKAKEFKLILQENIKNTFLRGYDL